MKDDQIKSLMNDQDKFLKSEKSKSISERIVTLEKLKASI